MSNKSANTIESFAIWGKTSDNHPLQCDAHINMFLPIRTNIDFPSIDIGLRIYDCHQVESIGIFIPFNLPTNNGFTDLSYKFSEEKIVRGIFNTNFIYKSPNDSPNIQIDFSNNRSTEIIPVDFNAISISKEDFGISLEIPICSKLNYNTVKYGYIIFRTPYAVFPQFLENNKIITQSTLESPIQKTRYLFSFKLNDLRTLPLRIRAKIGKSNIKLKYFLSISSQIDVTCTHLHKIRKMEYDLFKDFLPPNMDHSNVIVYHCICKPNETKDIEITLEKKQLNYKTIIAYSIIIIALNTVSCLFYDLLKFIFT